MNKILLTYKNPKKLKIENSYKINIADKRSGLWDFVSFFFLVGVIYSVKD